MDKEGFISKEPPWTLHIISFAEKGLILFIIKALESQCSTLEALIISRYVIKSGGGGGKLRIVM